MRTMPSRVPEPFDAVYLVLIDHGKHAIAYDETGPAEADLETTIQNFLTGRYENAVRGAAFNTAEGWSRDVRRTSPRSFCSGRSTRVTISARARSASSTDTSHSTRRRRNLAGSKCPTVSKRILRSGHRHRR
jgi:hypothetical protein